MLLPITQEEARGWLDKPQLMLEETVVPALQDTSNPGPYRPEYAWLYRFERRLAREVDRHDESLRPVLFGVSGPFSEAMSNAYCHGHRRDPTLGIRVTLETSPEGLLLSVEDSGPGFDVSATVARLREGGRYWAQAGLGLKRLSEHPQLGACFDKGGRRLGLLHLCAGLPAELLREGS